MNAPHLIGYGAFIHGKKGKLVAATSTAAVSSTAITT